MKIDSDILKPGKARDSYLASIKQQNEAVGAFLSFDPVASSDVWGAASPTAAGAGQAGGASAAAGTGQAGGASAGGTGQAGGASAAAGAGQAGGASAGGASAAPASLSGMPYGVKDNIAVKGQPLTCGSRMLEHMIAPYNATAIDRLNAAGARAIGKTNMDEFGMGSSTENSALAKTVNPWGAQLAPGGSSGGSAAAVAAGLVPFALGTDTGGSVRQPAGFCGVYGLKPTYGAVSRYGLVAYASSLEVIGILSQDLQVMRDVFACIRGKDEKDQTTIDWDQISAAHEGSSAAAQRAGKLAFIRGDAGLHPDVAAAYQKTKQLAQDKGFQVEEIDLGTLDYAVPAYYTIATAEASANLARYNGVRYGHRPDYAETPIELMRKSRSEGFGDEVKLRIMLGTYVLRSGFQDQYYVKAQKIRTKLYNELAQLYQRVEGLVLPVFPTPPFRLGGVELDNFQQKQGDRFTTLANLAGLPACAFPGEVVNGLPIGMQIMGPDGSEEKLISTIEVLQAGRSFVRPPEYQQLLYSSCTEAE